MTAWRVEKGHLDIGDGTMAAGCHHRPGRTAACGGCYARVTTALKLIQEGADGKRIADEVFAAMKAERATR